MDENKKNPVVSVVMSTHNRCEKFLPRAIESVINQSFPEWELLVVDDKSTDKTKEVVESYIEKDSRIKYICLPENFGCDTRPKNVGIMEAKGEYIAFLDDDNAFRADHLMALLNVLKRNPGLSFVYGDRYVIPSEEMKKPKEEGGEGLKPSVGIYSDYDPFLLMTKNYIDTSDVLVRKGHLLEVGGFDEKLRKFIDWNLWVRLAKTGKLFQRVALILTDYYLHDSMKSTTNKEGQYNPQTGLFTPTFDPRDCEISSGSIGGKPTQKVGIWTLLFDRLMYTKKMLESVMKTTNFPIEKWVFIDQGSTDGTMDWMMEFIKQHNIPNTILAGEENEEIYPSVTVDESKNDTIIKNIIYIVNKTNTGIAFASNQALDAMDPETLDYILKTDNDAIYLTKGWLEAMMKIYRSNQMFCLSIVIEGLVGMPQGTPRTNYGEMCDEMVGMVPHLGGICTMAPAKVYRSFRWPASAFKQGGNDVLFSSFVGKLGYQMVYLENYKLSHGISTLQQEKDFPEYNIKKDMLRHERYVPKQK